MARFRTQILIGLGSGLLAGLAAVALPPLLGFGRGTRSWWARAETVAVYVLGGLAAGGAAWTLKRSAEQGMLEEARIAAEDARVNARNSGMIH